jgi:D-alanyl-D-alanine carboxypeptidase (penicillin-binding protein 5/6)
VLGVFVKKYFILIILVSCTSVFAGKAPKALAKTAQKSELVKQDSSSKPVETPTDDVKPESPNSTISVDVEVLAKQAILVDYHTGTILLQKNAEQQIYPSSMTKIMTAYLVMEKLKAGVVNLDTLLTVGKNGWRVEGSKMFLDINKQVRVEDLLKGVIIQSGNDASIVLAEGLSGSEDAFAIEMTRRAHEMGATHTTFKNSTGLPHPEHLTTPKDLVIMAIHVLDDFPDYYHIYSEKEFTYNNITQGNRNPLLYRNIGCDGIKTGKTEVGGYGMVASCVQDGQRLILVINGMSSMQTRADEAAKLITWGMRTFSNYLLFKVQQLIDQIPILYGQEDLLPITVEKDAVVNLARVGRRDMKVKLNYQSPIAAPIQKGTQVGKIIVTSSALPKPIEIPLVAAVTIEKAGFFKRLKDSMTYLFWGNAVKKS